MVFESLINAMNIFAAAASNGAAATGADGAAPASCAEAGGGAWGMIAMYAVVIGLFYFLFIRPQNKRREQDEKMRKAVEIGDEITTIGGICGRVVSVKDDDTLVIETGSDRNKMKIRSWAISSNDTFREKNAAAETTEKKGFLGFGKK